MLIAILCAVFAIVDEIRQRGSDDDVQYEVLRRRVAYGAFPEEIKRKIFFIESVDAGSADHAAVIRKCGTKT